MPDATESSEIEPLILDLVEWIGREPRLYSDVMAAWRTSCPRLTVWEDACDRGLVARTFTGQQAMIEITAEGRQLLARSGRAAAVSNESGRLR